MPSLEVVHLVEVLTPLAVQDVEQDVAFQLPHGTRTGDGVDVGLTLGVGLLRVVDEDLQQLLAGELTGLAHGVGVDEVMVIDTHRVQGAQGAPRRSRSQSSAYPRRWRRSRRP